MEASLHASMPDLMQEKGPGWPRKGRCGRQVVVQGHGLACLDSTRGCWVLLTADGLSGPQHLGGHASWLPRLPRLLQSPPLGRCRLPVAAGMREDLPLARLREFGHLHHVPTTRHMRAHVLPFGFFSGGRGRGRISSRPRAERRARGGARSPHPDIRSGASVKGRRLTEAPGRPSFRPAFSGDAQRSLTWAQAGAGSAGDEGRPLRAPAAACFSAVPVRSHFPEQGRGFPPCLEHRGGT